MTANFSGLLNQTTVQSNTTEKPLEMELCAGVPNAIFQTLDTSAPYFVNAALNVSLAIATTFANLLVLLAMRHVTFIRLPSKLLLCSLVLTDLGAGLAVQPQFAGILFGEAMYPGLAWCELRKSFFVTRNVFGCASFFTLTAMSLDRYAALFSYVKYQQIVTTRRVCAVLAFVWSLLIFTASILLWNFTLWRVLAVSLAAVNFPIMFAACIKIYCRLQAQQVQPEAPDQAQEQAGNVLNMDTYRRTATVMMLVYVLFLICYIPFFCLFIVVAATGYTPLTLCFSEFAYTLAMLNSLLNPFVYCLRLPEIRTEVTKHLRKLCCRSSQQ